MELPNTKSEDDCINLTLEMPSLSIHLLIWYQGVEAPYMHACMHVVIQMLTSIRVARRVNGYGVLGVGGVWLTAHSDSCAFRTSEVGSNDIHFK